MASSFRCLKFGLAVSVIATCALLVAMSSVAQASLILVQPNGSPAATVAQSFTDLGAQGFGNAPRMMTMQNGPPVESGKTTPIDQEQGDAIDGANKSSTPTISTLGWTSGSKVGIGFNSNQTGNSGITMQSLILTIYNGTTAVGSFSLAASLTPLDFSATDLGLQQGNGNAVFNFGLNAAEQTQFNTILAMSGSSGFRAGLESTLGCPAGSPGTCQPSNDGADSFLGFAQPGGVVTTPEPSTTVLLGVALAGLGLLRFCRRRSAAA